MNELEMNALIIRTLSPLNVPVSYMNYNNTANIYIAFNEYNQTSFFNADDKEQYTKHFFQFDVFGAPSMGVRYFEVAIEMKKLMKQARFGRMFESDTYDDDMKKYRKIIRFSYISKEEN
ncbi:hypothetical protein Q4522_20990 [Oceanobacillus profundus]|nr:hypothetical protein [Oceanobacillus profundus]